MLSFCLFFANLNLVLRIIVLLIKKRVGLLMSFLPFPIMAFLKKFLNSWSSWRIALASAVLLHSDLFSRWLRADWLSSPVGFSTVSSIVSFHYFHPGKVQLYVAPFHQSIFLFASNSQFMCTFVWNSIHSSKIFYLLAILKYFML